uniref:caffeate O-methyltransferase n=1 Tax=Fagus sylvatica TaxID=28930 RepID=A0A2N9GZD0_FAGSY
MVDRILRLLASYSVVTCTLKHNHDGHDGPVLRLYGLTPVTKYYLRDQDASLASGMQLLHDKVFKDSWYFLKEAVLEGGIPFNKVHGMHAFEYPSKDSRFNHIFNKAMISHTTLVINKVLDKYKGFEDLKELVDVGGGLGLTLKMITSKYPNIKSINFDLSHVIQDAPPYPGVQHIQGDMFVGVPKGEVILLKCILHDWSDDRCLEILKNCYAELPDDGKVIVIELILPEAPETSAAVRCIMQIDLVMMTQNPGGKERTKQDFESLARRTGFKETHPSLVDGDVKEDESFPYAIQLANSFALPMALQSTIELGVFDILAKAGPGAKLSPSQIVAQMPTKNPDAAMMLDRILRMLASHSVLACSAIADDFGSFQRLYSLSSVSKHFVRNEDGVSLGPFMALLQDKVFLDSWSQLKVAILEGGIPFNRVHGTHAFEYPGLDPRFNQVFNTAMLNHTTIVMKQILEVYKGFEQLKLLVDVGGGLGVTLNLITSRYSHIKGINFDLPHVIQHGPPYPGVEHLGGDMFESVPKGDAIFMKWILHDWNDEHCLKLLKNCYNATPNDGKVIVVDAVLPIIPNISTFTKSTSQLDVLMMTQNPGGKERTQQEFTALATKAGFSGIRYECFVCNFWVMEFFNYVLKLEWLLRSTRVQRMGVKRGTPIGPISSSILVALPPLIYRPRSFNS